MSLNNKTVNAVITQLELESKNEKEDPDKTFKDKKFCDEDLNIVFTEYKPLVVEINTLHNLEKTLYTQAYHPMVPTPPPNV